MNELEEEAEQEAKEAGTTEKEEGKHIAQELHLNDAEKHPGKEKKCNHTISGNLILFSFMEEL